MQKVQLCDDEQDVLASGEHLYGKMSLRTLKSVLVRAFHYEILSEESDNRFQLKVVSFLFFHLVSEFLAFSCQQRKPKR